MQRINLIGAQYVYINNLKKIIVVIEINPL